LSLNSGRFQVQIWEFLSFLIGNLRFKSEVFDYFLSNHPLLFEQLSITFWAITHYFLSNHPLLFEQSPITFWAITHCLCCLNVPFNWFYVLALPLLGCGFIDKLFHNLS
jgi:hypothetical protein